MDVFVNNSALDNYAGNQGSQMMVVECAAGETVHVEAEQLDQQALFVGFNFASFSGHYVGSV